jgi:hypothetical protein
MNERIKELEKQAWEFVDKTWNWANANNPSQATLFKTKFAELIVRECVDICMKNQYEGTPLYNNGSISSAEFIKQHFGVEK